MKEGRDCEGRGQRDGVVGSEGKMMAFVAAGGSVWSPVPDLLPGASKGRRGEELEGTAAI